MAASGFVGSRASQRRKTALCTHSVRTALLTARTVSYARLGLDWDSTFEGELLQRTSHCKVYGYDFTARGFGHGVPRALKGRTHFARLGLGAVDSHGPADEPKMWTLRSLMAANGHDHIDVLHIDIEGWEFEVLRAMVVDFAGIGSLAPVPGGAGEVEVQERGTLPFGQLLIEFHVWHEKFEQFLAFWEMLENVGLRPFMSEVRPRCGFARSLRSP